MALHFLFEDYLLTIILDGHFEVVWCVSFTMDEERSWLPWGELIGLMMTILMVNPSSHIGGTLPYSLLADALNFQVNIDECSVERGANLWLDGRLVVWVSSQKNQTKVYLRLNAGASHPVSKMKCGSK